MHTVKDRGLYFGIEVTASHNPASYNGIKLFTEEGRDASVEVTKTLEKLIKKINTSVELEETSIGNIELADEE